MSYTIIYDPLAVSEIKEAAAWYQQSSAIVALNFVSALRERLQNISDDPLRYRNTYKDFRETSLKNSRTVLFILLMIAGRLLL